MSILAISFFYHLSLCIDSQGAYSGWSLVVANDHQIVLMWIWWRSRSSSSSIAIELTSGFRPFCLRGGFTNKFIDVPWCHDGRCARLFHCLLQWLWEFICMVSELSMDFFLRQGRSRVWRTKYGNWLAVEYIYAMFDRNIVWSALYLVTHQRTRTQPQDARGMKIPFLCAVTLTLYLCGMDNRREVNVKCSGRQFIDQAHVFLCTFLQSCNCHAIVGKRFALFTIILYRPVCCFVFDLDYCRGGNLKLWVG